MEASDVNKHIIHGYPFYILKSQDKTAIFETPPAAYAGEWLEIAGKADYLVLCGNEQYPGSVKLLLERCPNVKIVATPYILYSIESILERPLPGVKIRNGGRLTVGEQTLVFGTASHPGQPATVGVTLEGKAEALIPVQLARHEVPFEKPTVVIPYVSGLSFTETLAELVAQGVKDSGELEVRLIDLTAEDPANIAALVPEAAGVLVGTPTVRGDAAGQVWELLTQLRSEKTEGIYAGAFGSYVWSGEGADNVIGRMRQLKMNVVDDGCNIQFRADEACKRTAYEYGYNFGCVIQNRVNPHKSKLVKCLVCGEIFDASLGKCPVCGVGPEKCVPVEEEIIDFHLDTDRRYVILGGGAAAISAAEAIRKRDKTGRVIMVSSETSPPINRPMLTKNMVTAALDPVKMEVKTREWYDENRIELRLGSTVCAIDVNAKSVTLQSGDSIAYDRLIYALGAECFVPPIPGREKSGVISIRHLSDVDAVWQRITAARKIAVIGGGVLGLEAASELKKTRRAVTVLETSPGLMRRQLDTDTSERLRNACESFKVKVMTGVNVAEIEGGEAVSGVRLGDGTVVEADIAILSCGMRAVTAPAKDAGLDCGNAVKVDAKMLTSQADIYACGDCAEFEGVNYQLWSEAIEQGRVAGANAVGDDLTYETKLRGMDFAGMKTEIFAIGDVGNGGRSYQTVEHRDEIGKKYEKLWFAEGKLCGVVLMGDMRRMEELTTAVCNAKPYSEMEATD